ncbi:MAG TPA: adenylate/guanylate cyclase domain-containing protein [Candidatus Baltobacteraceae bacterium]|nr:adenylate/guanylate cyclase domain-containing protein [Candidatus Baltobacteraceae bacterium]
MAPASVAQGLLTFLFTDIVGSTRLWERAPQAARQALARHNEILANIVASHDGTIFKTVGDACCCVFADPAQAVRAAIAMQRALSQEAWPQAAGTVEIRIGIHTGEAIAEGGDYFGPTLNRVARLMSAAHGGQIVVSASTANHAAQTLAPECTVVDLGAHRLKDLAEPQHVYQICADGLALDFPALASLDAQPNNLPSQLSTFVGRAEELAQLRQLVANNRLVTVCGVGGIGKTRVALQVAAETIGAYADGSWIVRLADITDPQLVPQSVASTLHVTGIPGQPLTETLCQHLATKNLFLLLDNAEHVLQAAAQLVNALLTSCPGLTVLVTSCEPLHLAGEHIVRIGPLSVSDAETLFVSRACLHKTDEYVNHICGELDRLPLAIELAAGRVGTLTTKQLDARLNRILPVLTSKDASHVTRHRTLQATIEWSYRLLNPKEQRFFTLLSVFEGGFTIEACEAVAWAGEEDDPAYELLDALVDKSFVTAEPFGDAMRYRLLESLHGFARARLAATGESAMARDLHFEYFKTLADRWGTWQTADEEHAYLQAFAVEIPNLRAALERGLERDEPSAAFELLLKVALYWQQHCSIAEARAWLERACRRAGARPSILHAKLLRRASTFATIEDDYVAARELTDLAREMFSELNDRPGTAEAIHNLAVIEQRSGSEEEAYRLYGQALEMFEQTNHEIGIITALFNLAQTAKRRGEAGAAKGYLERGMSLCTSQVHADRLATFWLLRAQIAMDEAAYEEAAPALVRALEMKRALDDRHDIVEVLCTFAVLEIRRNDLQRARGYARDAAELAQQLSVPSLLIGCLEVWAVIAIRNGNDERAARAFALSKGLRKQLGYVYAIMSELAPDLEQFAHVAPAEDASREAVARAVGELTAV